MRNKGSWDIFAANSRVNCFMHTNSHITNFFFDSHHIVTMEIAAASVEKKNEKQNKKGAGIIKTPIQ